MNKLWTSREQVVALSKTTILGICCMVYAVHDLVMNKLWTSHEQVMNNSWTSREQVVNKLWTSREQVVSCHAYFVYLKGVGGSRISKTYSYSTWTLPKQKYMEVFGSMFNIWRQIGNFKANYDHFQRLQPLLQYVYRYKMAILKPWVNLTFS